MMATNLLMTALFGSYWCKRSNFWLGGCILDQPMFDRPTRADRFFSEKLMEFIIFLYRLSLRQAL